MYVSSPYLRGGIVTLHNWRNIQVGDYFTLPLHDHKTVDGWQRVIYMITEILNGQIRYCASHDTKQVYTSSIGSLIDRAEDVF